MSVVSLSGAPLASAEPPPAARTLSATEARSAGVTISAVRHRERGGDLLELQFTTPTRAASALLSPAEEARRASARLLDSAANGSLAIADSVGDPEAGLTISHPDGGQAQTALGGVSGAAFAADGSWLAAVDSGGRLWRIDTSTGVASSLADGPYGGPIAFTRDGALLLVEVSSVEAPFASRVVRFNPTARRTAVVEADAGFVFSAGELSDGSIAVVIHPFGGGVQVHRIGIGASSTLATLDARAIDASLNADGSRVAYSIAGAVYLSDTTGGTTRRLGDGELPRLAQDGTSLLTLRDGRGILLDSAGRELDRFDTATVAWAKCGGGCAR